ncbi:MAG: arsenate reductase (glutaredoxin) [Panacagrimonas sp.]
MVKLYHNPRCSKSRQTLQLLNDHGVEPQIVLYLQTPPDTSTLDDICRALKLAPQDIIRFKEARAKELGLKAKDERDRAQWLRLMADNPVLIERPIAVKGKKAALGRPPENVLALL